MTDAELKKNQIKLVATKLADALADACVGSEFLHLEDLPEDGTGLLCPNHCGLRAFELDVVGQFGFRATCKCGASIGIAVKELEEK